MADRKEDSEENHVGSQDLHHMSLHSVTLCAMPCVEAVLQRMRWADCDFPILNKIQCCGFPPPPTKVWENLYPGRRMVMDLGGSSGNWEAAQLCLRQTQFFFFFFFCRWSQEHNCDNFPHLPFPFPFSVVLFQSPFSQSSEWWDYDPEMGSLLIFQFLHFLFQLREGSEALDFVSHGHYYFFSPIH